MKRIIYLCLFFYSLSLQAQNMDNWTQVGMVVFPENPSVQTTGMGRVSSLVYHPYDSTILYAVSSSGGIWRSSNEGKSWASINDFFPRTQCASLCINPLNPNTLYLGTGDANYNNPNGLGLWKSTDAGKTWVQCSSGLGNRLVSKIWINPNDTSVLLAAAGDGVYKSENGAQSWVKRTTVSGSYRDLVQKANTGSTVFFAATNTELYRSVDLGDTWTALSHPGTPSGLKIGVSPADSTVLYTVSWSSGNNRFNGLYRSVNDGNSFTLQADTPNILGYSANGSSQDGQGAYNLAIGVDPRDINTLYVGAINIWKSTNGGQSWSIKSHWAYGVHADKHHWLFSPFNPNKLYITHDGGVDRTEDGGDTWTTLSDGLSASEFYKMGQSILRQEVLIGGLQDNGLNIYEDGIFRTIRGGDWTGDFHFDYVDSNVLYFNGGKKRKISGGEDDINGEGNYLVHPTDSQVMFYGTTELYRTDNLRANPATQVSWSKLSSFNSNPNIIALSVSPQAPETVYFSRSDGSLWRCSSCLSANPNITQITSKPSGTITQIYAHERDSNCLFISTQRKLYRSSNKGQTWIDYTQNLPDVNIKKFIVDGTTNDTVIYLANAFGVYFRRASQTNWTNFSGSLPTIAPISDMEIYLDPVDPSASRLRLSTYGRGIWQTDLYRTQNLAPIADFQINSTMENCAALYLFNDRSTQSPTYRRWTISPSTGWSFINGSDSASRVAEIQVHQSGIYLVTLEVGNAYGNDIISYELRYSALNGISNCSPTTSTLGAYTIGIYRFELNGIDNSSAYTLNKSDNGEDFSCRQSTRIAKGGTYTASITNGTNYNESAKIFIDYNDNGQFESGELAATFSAGKGRRSAQITVPANGVVSGKFLRLRVISDYGTVSGPCSNLSYGQYEDYAVLIDTIAPKVTISVPKPKVYSQFTALFTLNKWVPDFDESKFQVSNATVQRFQQTGALTFEAVLRPILNGSVGISVPANGIFDEAGNGNAWVAASSEFVLAIDSFLIPGVSVRDSVVKQANGGKIYLEVPYGTSTSALMPKFSTVDTAILLLGGKVFRSELDTVDASDSVEFVLRSKDGFISHSWWLFVKVLPNTSCEMKQFSLQNPAVQGSIQQQGFNGSVDVYVPFSTDLKSLIAEFTLADYAEARVNNQAQTSGQTVLDFSNTVVYEIVAQDSAYRCRYQVDVHRMANTEAELIAYSIIDPPSQGILVPKAQGWEVRVLLPYGTSLDSLVAEFQVSDSAQVHVNGQIQTNGVSWNNFNDTLWYEVIAQSGLFSNQFAVIIEIQPNTACDLLAFGLQSPLVSGAIQPDSSGGVVEMELPFRSSLKGLNPVFTVSPDAKVFVNGQEQFSGTSIQDFSLPVVYQVVSASGNQSKIYEVIARIRPNDSCEMLYYSFSSVGIDGVMDAVDTGGIITVSVPPGQLSDITKVIASFQISDSARAYVNGVRQWSNNTPNDFSNPVNYQVVSQDSTCKKGYEVRLSILGGFEVTEKLQVTLWPNPNKGQVHIAWHTNTHFPVKLQVFDAVGKLILQHEANQSKHVELDLSAFPPGSYIAQYRRGNESGMLRIIINE